MKYELMEVYKAYRIRALRDIDAGFFYVRAGEYGGLVDGEHNLSQDGNCWITYDARAVGKARVKGNALLMNHARISDNAVIKDEALVFENAKVNKFAQVVDCAIIYGNALITDRAIVGDKTRICENVTVKNDLVLTGSRLYKGNLVIDSLSKIWYSA